MDDDVKPVLLLQKSMVAAVLGAVGSRMFRHLYVRYGDGREEDVIRDGELACALFVSRVLAGFGMIDRGHATVGSAIAKLKENPLWDQLSPSAKIEPGDVLVWEEKEEAGDMHSHIGFAVGGGRAVSNSDSLGEPVEHDIGFDGKRAIIAIWRYDFDSHK